ncbi:hypothetical protein DXG03_008336, partial [Asterophora parasitica]
PSTPSPSSAPPPMVTLSPPRSSPSSRFSRKRTRSSLLRRRRSRTRRASTMARCSSASSRASPCKTPRPKSGSACSRRGWRLRTLSPRASSSRGVRTSVSSPSWTSGTWTTERKSGEPRLRS